MDVKGKKLGSLPRVRFKKCTVAVIQTRPMLEQGSWRTLFVNGRLRKAYIGVKIKPGRA